MFPNSNRLKKIQFQSRYILFNIFYKEYRVIEIASFQSHFKTWLKQFMLLLNHPARFLWVILLQYCKKTQKAFPSHNGNFFWGKAYYFKYFKKMEVAMKKNENVVLDGRGTKRPICAIAHDILRNSKNLDRKTKDLVISLLQVRTLNDGYKCISHKSIAKKIIKKAKIGCTKERLELQAHIERS